MEFKLKQHFFPVYDVPEGSSLDEEFRRLAEVGLVERIKALPYAVDEQAYRDRLEFELKVIIEKGFPAYFLIVQDFINWAKSNGIPVGPGRGSAAGSLVVHFTQDHRPGPDPVQASFRAFFERGTRVHARYRRRLLLQPP